ncbi:MAG: ABC transporter permease [Candidatus Syntropharchaeia archaeon]
MASGWKYLLSACILLLIWHVLAEVIASSFFPPPAVAFFTFFEELFFGNLAHHFLKTGLRMMYGLLMALLAGVPLGLACREEKFDDYMGPIIYITYSIPHISLLPVIILLFGIGDLSKVFLVALIVFFKILVTTRDAAKNVDEHLIYSVLSLGATKRQIYTKVIFPACLPEIMTALRISIGTSIAVLFFAESFATTEGLGYVILDSWGRSSYEEMFGGIIGMALLGSFAYITIDFLEKKICKWKFL